MRKVKAAFVGFGEINTPREIIERKCIDARKRLEDEEIDVVWTDPVSDDPEGRDVHRALSELKGQEVDLVIACIAGWIPSHAVISVLDPFRHKPVLLWGLTGWQEGDRFVTTADQAGTTALRKPMADMGFLFKYVVDYYGQPSRMAPIVSFARAARARSLLRDARIGTMGYRDMRLYGTLHDGVSLRGQLGPEIEPFEMLEIERAMNAADPAEVKALSDDVRANWTFTKEPREGTVENSVKLYLGLRTKIRERGFAGLSLLDVDGVKKFWGFAPAGAFMLVHEKESICTIPENDIMGAVTQVMTRFLTGQVGAYLEFYEFMENGALMGVPDYVPSEIVDGPVTVMPTAFGEFGEGLLNVSRIKPGPVTLARLTYTGDWYSLHMTTGEATTPRAWEEAGWTPPAPQLPSLEVAFHEPVEDFIQTVMGQHYILSYGDQTESLTDLCHLLGIEVI